MSTLATVPVAVAPSAEVTKMTAGTAHRVDSNVYISGYLIAADPGFVRRAGITRIVKMFADDPSYYGGYHRHPGVRYLVVPAADEPDYDIRAGAEAAVRFIREGAMNGERILVHCHAGISRSATIVLLHLMVNRKMPLDLALARLRLVRPFINPNAGFMRHLRATDARLQRLRVGDERDFVAPLPVLAGDYDAALLRRLARDEGSHAGDAPREQPPAHAADTRPWTFSEPDGSTPL